ncbi:hypothetical protein J2X65_003552 [Ancylobacter sp. 3268]|uniref:hypothetical protein n=1 Tax=Ancylobacter sp. 3268 TaxID=2817752 RepID=UPI002858204E|nr:hypothetical protein [Ancylobacter sp. 3268]MDR6954184.1 hypothetical protein [Ancylobacter sp. 3268]
MTSERIVLAGFLSAILAASPAVADSIPIDKFSVFGKPDDRAEAVEAATFVKSSGNICFSISGGISMPSRDGAVGFRLMCDKFLRTYDVVDNGVNRVIFQMESGSPFVLGNAPQ